MLTEFRFSILVLTLTFCVAIPLPEAESANKEVNDKQFHIKLLEAARQYQTFGKVDDLRRWAPWLCMAPPPSKARISTSADTATHGRKIYFVFAKDREAYVKQSADQIGQIIVKESWMPPAGLKEGSEDNTTGSAKQLTEKHDLFIMMKLDPKTADTDEGWVYGTITADGQKVTSAGRVQSCMGCHMNAQHNRLFGMKN